LNNHLGQDHRGVKQRYRLMLGFKGLTSASRFCGAFEEIRSFLHPQTRRHEKVSLRVR
jgi:transposase-like protein